MSSSPLAATESSIQTVSRDGSNGGKRKKLRTTEKSSGNNNWVFSYGGLICLVIVFFVSGTLVGSFLVERSRRNVDSSTVFPDYIPKNMLETVDASSVTSSVSVKGRYHLRAANKPEDEHEEVETSPFRMSASERENQQNSQGNVNNNILSQPLPQLRSIFSAKQETASVKSKLPFATISQQPQQTNVGPMTLINDRAYSLHCQDDGYLLIPATAQLESSQVLMAAWVYLDESEVHNKDMRTIFSNKEPGCEAAEGQNGFALFVNAWQSSDRKVYLEYGGSRSGCNKLDSGDVTLNSRQWYHIAVALTESYAAMFIDGAVVGQHFVTDPHILSKTASLVGRYSSAAPYALYGNVSTLSFVHDISLSSAEDIPPLTEIVQQLQQLNTARDVPHLQALYPLEDAAYEKPNSFARALVGSSSTSSSSSIAAVDKQGKYMFSSFGGGVAGVKFPLITGIDDTRVVTDAMRQESDKLAYKRRDTIKAGMRHAWKGYKAYAWGNDELKPLSNRGQDNWGGMGVTLVDTLDTLWLMGLKEEFQEARDWVATKLTFDRAGQVSVFETTIRELGGLLAAYDFSQDRVFLDKAKVLGDRLMRAFTAAPRTGIPSAMVNLRTGAPANGWAGATAILSELGSLQLEFRYLGYQLQDNTYEKTAMTPMQVMARKNPRHGLYPIKVHMDSGEFADSMVTFGALGDSFYEYLLKLWLQGGKQETWLRETYDRAMNGAIEKLLQASSPSGLAFFADWNGHSTYRKMDHLVCFVPGMLALGAYNDPLGMDSGRAQRDLSVAKAMMYTCREMYHRMTSGISAEYVEFPPGRDLVPGPSVDFYILRPETAESLFILHQLTGDPIYRDWAWEIWEAIEKHCKTPSGYASIRNVNSAHTGQDDRMESFFLAETIKYLYLVQDPDVPVDLRERVFNTEAHPMKIFDPVKHKAVPLN